MKKPIIGSMAKVSRSRAALVAALEGAASADAQTELLNIRELDLPMYNPDDDAPTGAVTSSPLASEMSRTSTSRIRPKVGVTPTRGSAPSSRHAIDWLHLLRDRDPPSSTTR